MRLYKILNRYVDLDHVLSVTDPEIKWTSECYEQLIFTVTLAFQDKPLKIAYDPDTADKKEWMDNYFKKNPGQVRHNCEPFMHGDWLKTKMHEIEAIHKDFIEAWKGTPSLTTHGNN